MRPGTSYSSAKGPPNWRATFKGFNANSSMVDLSAPARKQSVSSLRYQTSEANLKNPWMNNSTANLPLPSPLSGSGPRIGTPDRPSTANGPRKEWINPLDVHFGKDPTGAPPSLASTEAPARSPLGLEFSPDDKDETPTKVSSPVKETAHPFKNETVHKNGYPSPPQSVSNADQTLSPTVSDLSMVNGHIDPSSLPSPAASAPRTSEERWDAPVIRNVSAKRDTTTFHSPRRRSFTMDVKQQELERLRKQRQTEGFAGSFADFDFGEIVTKQPSIEQFPEPPATRIQPSSPPMRQQAPKGRSNTITSKQSETAPTRPDRSTSISGSSTLPALSPSNSPLIDANAFDLPPPAPVEAPAAAPARPATGYGRLGGPPSAAAGAHPGSTPVTTFEPPPRLGFRARLGSDASSRRKTGPPKPLQTTAAPPVPAQADEPSPKSPFLTPSNSDNQMTETDGAKKSLDIKTPKSPYQKTVLEGDFPVTKGLPRGRQPPRRPPRSDEAPSPEKPDFSIPNWSSLNGAEPRHSAMPPPLAMGSQPRPSTSSGAPSMLPSPSFASLELSISGGGESLTQAFEEALGKTSLAPGLVGDFFSIDTTNLGNVPAGTRVEAKKAPPRPAPVTLPPSPTKNAEPRSPAPTQSEFGAGFI